jgi:hypothetical protein
VGVCEPTRQGIHFLPHRFVFINTSLAQLQAVLLSLLFAVEGLSLDALDFEDGNPSALTSEDAQRLRFSRTSIPSGGRTVKDSPLSNGRGKN